MIIWFKYHSLLMLLYSTLTQIFRWLKAISDYLNGYFHLLDNLAIDKEVASNLLKAFLVAMDDYTLDRRGDIGAWVREAAMQGIVDILFMLAKEDKVCNAYYVLYCILY